MKKITSKHISSSKDSIHVYIKQFPFETDGEICCKDREREINECSSKKVRDEKFYSWKLLEHAIKDTFGLELEKINFVKINTKWQCKDCFFSISHCKNIVAVAVARQSIGLDIEEINNIKFEKINLNKILTEREILDTSIDKNTLGICRLWTIKEAIYKFSNDIYFQPNKIESGKFPSYSKKLKTKNKEFLVSLVSQDISKINFHIDEKLMNIE